MPRTPVIPQVPFQETPEPHNPKRGDYTCLLLRRLPDTTTNTFNQTSCRRSQRDHNTRSPSGARKMSPSIRYENPMSSSNGTHTASPSAHTAFSTGNRKKQGTHTSSRGTGHGCSTHSGGSSAGFHLNTATGDTRQRVPLLVS